MVASIFAHTFMTGGGAFSPLSLFSGGEQGVWYDPSDLSTVWQDSARTVPGAVNSVVGCIDDKSGRGFNATQATTSLKPILRQVGALYYLEFDGFDDFLATASINFAATDKMSVFAGVRKLSDAEEGAVAGLGNTGTTSGSVAIGSGTTSGDASRRTWYMSQHGGEAETVAGAAIYTSPDTRVIAAMFNRAQATQAAEMALRLNGTAQSLTFSNASLATGNLANGILYIGRRAGTSLRFNGHIYGLIVCGKLSTSPEIAATETYLAAKTGVTL